MLRIAGRTLHRVRDTKPGPSPPNRLRHPAENAVDQAGAPPAPLLLRRHYVLGDAALVKIIQELDVIRLGDGEILLADKHRVVIEKRPGTVGGVARSFEITNCDGSSPWAIMACSTSGSLRMNSAENPPTVDCSVIDTASPRADASRPKAAAIAFACLGLPERAEGSRTRSSPGMTASRNISGRIKKVCGADSSICRPGERRDPYAVSIMRKAALVAFLWRRSQQRTQRLWVPAPCAQLRTRPGRRIVWGNAFAQQKSRRCRRLLSHYLTA